MAYNYEYPYTDPNRYNSDWLINAMRKLQEEWNIFVPTHDVKFGGIWDGTKTYEAYTIVSDNGLNSYISRVAVPAGKQISDETYWVRIGNYNAQITEEINRAINEIEERIIKRSVIFISDSYGNRTNADGKNFFTIISEYLSLENYYFANIGGASFAHKTAGYSFIDLLRSLENTVENKNAITDIVVIGGANDTGYPYQDTLNAISTFVSYAKQTYANAKITLAHVGLTLDNDSMYKRRTVSIKAWQDAVQYGVGYMYNSEYVLCDSRLVEDDMCHPNSDGVNAIAEQVAQGMVSGSCNVVYELLPTDTVVSGSIVNPTNPDLIYTTTWNGTMRRVNNTVEIYSNGGTVLGRFAYNTAESIPAGHEIRIQFSDTLMFGYSGSGKTIFGFLISRVDNSIYPVSCTWHVGNPKSILLRIFTIYDLPANGYDYNLILNLNSNID